MMRMDKKRIIVGISGADGVIIGVQLLSVLQSMPDVETFLVMSSSAQKNIELQCDMGVEDVRRLADHVFDENDLGASISSGSFKTDGMIIAPCSMKTLSGIAHGFEINLLIRAADVCLKEGRKVVLMPRETPLGITHINNLLSAAQAGCIIVPPMLTFYNEPRGLDDVIYHVLGKALGQFGITPPGLKVWRDNTDAEGGTM